MGWVKEDADGRQQVVQVALREAFSKFIEARKVEVIVFSSMSAKDLAEAITRHPVILKPLVACCNIAARAIERDLGIKNLNTYLPRLSEDQAKVLAGYIKPFLPPYLELPALVQVDRVACIDKEIRKSKGRWERRILEALNRHGKRSFRKRMFEWEGDLFELDAATPERGDIEVGVDIKRIEARRLTSKTGFVPRTSMEWSLLPNLGLIVLGRTARARNGTEQRNAAIDPPIKRSIRRYAPGRL